MRTNRFNEEYLMLTIEEIDTITYSAPKEYAEELRCLMRKIKKKIFEKATFEKYPITDESQIAIKKNSQLGMILINYLQIIDENMIKNAISTSLNENNYNYAERLVEIILETGNNLQITYHEFEKKYGQDLAYFVLNNSSIEEDKENKSSAKDEHVFLYEDSNLIEINLQKNTKPYKH